LVTTPFLKQPGGPAWANDEEVKVYKEFLKKHVPSVDPDDYSVLVAHMNVHAVERVPRTMRRPVSRWPASRRQTWERMKRSDSNFQV
jgi:branched-chain amino acid transport system substrate-binding protein